MTTATKQTAKKCHDERCREALDLIGRIEAAIEARTGEPNVGWDHAGDMGRVVDLLKQAALQILA